MYYIVTLAITLLMLSICNCIDDLINIIIVDSIINRLSKSKLTNLLLDLGGV